MSLHPGSNPVPCCALSVAGQHCDCTPCGMCAASAPKEWSTETVRAAHDALRDIARDQPELAHGKGVECMLRDRVAWLECELKRAESMLHTRQQTLLVLAVLWIVCALHSAYTLLKPLWHAP